MSKHNQQEDFAASMISELIENVRAIVKSTVVSGSH
jgi:hypothetical protein